VVSSALERWWEIPPVGGLGCGFIKRAQSTSIGFKCVPEPVHFEAQGSAFDLARPRATQREHEQFDVQSEIARALKQSLRPSNLRVTV
jgi:hypothetical protein